MHKYTLLIIGLCLSLSLFSQSIDEIKADRQTYIWGEGNGLTISRADQEALGSLISQISAQVEGKFSLLKEENNENFSEKYNAVINTYSSATLNNTERIIVSNEPDAKVFRFIKRSEIDKVFNQRKQKIKEFASFAKEAEQNNQIADALRYYYWALTLLKSHPDGDAISYKDDMGREFLLATWLPVQLNNVFANLSFAVREKIPDETYTTFILDITYKNNPVVNLDYSFFDGRDMSNLISAKDGRGIIELSKLAADSKTIQLKAEYIFEREALINRELGEVMKQIEPIPFRKSYFNLSLIEQDKVKAIEKVEEKLASYGISEVKDKSKQQATIESIIDAIKKGDYNSVKKEFTQTGFQSFEKLITYGNAKIIDASKLKFIQFNDQTICRSITMSFHFKNNKQFIEDIVFNFDGDGKISNLAFALSQTALEDIIRKKVWNEKDRLVLVSFLEHYKTAYALKRLEYIESIFADDALIITGSVVKVSSSGDTRFKDNKIIKYNRQTKEQYIKNLRYSFTSKEYINLKFEDSEIRKAGKGGDIYGVQIKQNYYSSNYGDTGYLFLMVDLNNPDLPIIHVRTWQPEKNADGSIYGLSDF